MISSMALHPNIREFKLKVRCDGIILILRGAGGIVKQKPVGQLTVDLRYIKDGNYFVDRNNVIYTMSTSNVSNIINP